MKLDLRNANLGKWTVPTIVFLVLFICCAPELIFVLWYYDFVFIILYRPTCISDENECLVDNGGCEHVCVNTNDGFFCTCEQGFTLESGKYCDGKLSDYIRYKINPYHVISYVMYMRNDYHMLSCKFL